jgi:uncharacterized protein YajQ (UPF0234 family)
LRKTRAPALFADRFAPGGERLVVATFSQRQVAAKLMVFGRRPAHRGAPLGDGLPERGLIACAPLRLREPGPGPVVVRRNFRTSCASGMARANSFACNAFFSSLRTVFSSGEIRRWHPTGASPSRSRSRSRSCGNEQREKFIGATEEVREDNQSVFSFLRNPQSRFRPSPMPSFDIVSEVDKQEIDNAINQARKELATRFDFKGTTAEVIHEKDKIILTAEDAARLRGLREIVVGKLGKRGVDLRNIDQQEPAISSMGHARQELKIQQGLEGEKAKEIIQAIKAGGLQSAEPIAGSADSGHGKKEG